jgi:hypothetical protein
MVAQGHLMSAARHAMLCRNSFIFPGLFTHLTFYKHEPTLPPELRSRGISPK